MPEAFKFTQFWSGDPVVTHCGDDPAVVTEKLLNDVLANVLEASEDSEVDFDMTLCFRHARDATLLTSPQAPGTYWLVEPRLFVRS